MELSSSKDSLHPELTEEERIQLHASIKHAAARGQVPIITQANWRDWMSGVREG